MVIRTFFDKNNTIVKNNNINTARNPVTELFYGGIDVDNSYSRFLFHFDETRLIDLYTGGTITDLTKLTHTLKFTNTTSFDMDLVNGVMGTKDRTSSFDLIAFKVNQLWDEGVGYDYETCGVLVGDCATSNMPSNWIYPQTGLNWSGGSGIYSGSPSGITVSTQHFDIGNENLEMDITDYVNGVLTGNTNHGLGIAYARPYELTSTRSLQYVGFFTRHTQTFYEPYIETIYNNHILDDRNNFFLDKPNKLYLYVNLGGNPTNLDTLPSVDILDEQGATYSSYTSSQVNHITKGVYSIDITVPTTSSNTGGYLFNDVWSNILINGVSRPDITLSFELRDSLEYYNIGDNDSLPKKVAVSISGIRNQERIKRGDIKKVIVSARIPYTVEQAQKIGGLKYRLYVLEGKNELTVTDFQPIEIASNYNYFLLDTLSLIPNTYYLDVLVESNLEVTTLKDVISFDIVSQSNARSSQ
jgi:hypothetical protein